MIKEQTFILSETVKREKLQWNDWKKERKCQWNTELNGWEIILNY